MKKLLLTIAATFGMTALTMAQNVPSYVPSNGLVGWWPFNGNANDESGNGNNGVVNGAILTSDRFGNQNSAFNFDGIISYINIGHDSSLLRANSSFSLSVWLKLNALNPDAASVILTNRSGSNTTDVGSTFCITGSSNGLGSGKSYLGTVGANFIVSNQPIIIQMWKNIVFTYDYNTLDCAIYEDGIVVFTGSLNHFSESATFDHTFGREPLSIPTGGGNAYAFNGDLDDIGIWNRVLTQQEITYLHNATTCSNNTSITPQTNTLSTGAIATFTASTSDPNPSYVWQSDLGQGFQTLNNFGNYSGTSTASLNVTNVQLSEHNQPIRVITTSGNCIDTSNVAIISITDTCINTITDTTLITVTDTLVINTTITSLNPPNNANTIKVFPNPTNDHITIDYGNFSVMNLYQLKIENSLGQQVFQTNITQQSDYLNLTSWGGNGLYFVHIIDPQGNTIDIRKILLQ